MQWLIYHHHTCESTKLGAAVTMSHSGLLGCSSLIISTRQQAQVQKAICWEWQGEKTERTWVFDGAVSYDPQPGTRSSYYLRQPNVWWLLVRHSNRTWRCVTLISFYNVNFCYYPGSLFLLISKIFLSHNAKEYNSILNFRNLFIWSEFKTSISPNFLNKDVFCFHIYVFSTHLSLEQNCSITLK